MKKPKFKKWLVINRKGQILVDTDDLDLAWSICESYAICGATLTVTTLRELKRGDF